MAEASNFFVTAKEEILSVLDASVSGQLTSLSNIAGTLGRYGVSIYVLWYAFTVLARKQQTPVPDFIWNLCRFSIILMFVQNAGGWLNTSLVAIDGLKDSLSGNNDAWLWLDQLWTKVQQVAAHVMSKDTSTYVKTRWSYSCSFYLFWWNISISCMCYSFSCCGSNPEIIDCHCTCFYLLPDVWFFETNV